MRVLVIAPEQLPVPPIKGGSVENCIYNIFWRLANTDSVSLISRSHPRLPRSSILKNGRLKIHRLAHSTPTAYILAALSKVRKQHFDVIQIENRPNFVPYVKRCFPGTPIMLSLHSLTFMSRLPKGKAHNILSQVNQVTSVVGFVTQWMKKKYPAFAYKFKTTLLGVDTNKFRPRSIAYKQSIRRHWKVSNSYNILFLGRIVPKKGLHTLVKTVAILKRKIKNPRLIAVGAAWPGVQQQTSYMRKVRGISAQLKVPIRFTGYIPTPRVHDMYQLGDVFVCPTQYQEGFALVNSEAMASGIPVVASNRGGIREIIKHGHSGLLVTDYLNPAAFAKAILNLKNSPTYTHKITMSARQRVVNQFSWQSTARRLRQKYLSLN